MGRLTEKSQNWAEVFKRKLDKISLFFPSNCNLLELFPLISATAIIVNPQTVYNIWNTVGIGIFFFCFQGTYFLYTYSIKEKKVLKVHLFDPVTK